MTRALMIVALLALPLAAAAQQPSSEPATIADEGGEQNQSCDALTGGKATRAANESYRKRHVHRVLLEGNNVFIDHSSPSWEGPPIELVLDGLELDDVEQGWERASITLSADLARRLGCPAGKYGVQMDDALGNGVRILFVLDGILLVEAAGKLRYVAAAGVTPPTWLLAWRLPGVTVKRAVGGQRGRKRAPPRRKSKPRRRR